MRQHFFPVFILCLLIVTASFLFTSCHSDEQQDKILTATLRGPSAMAMIHMIEDTPRLSNTPSEFIICNEPNQVKAMILEEKVQFAVLPSTMGALLYNKTGKYILAGIPVWGTLYLFGTDTSITVWKDLEEKKVSLMAKGMTPDIMFRYLAEKNGADLSRIETDYSFPGHIELANAIIAGVSELGVISEPLVSLSMAKNSTIHALLDFNKEWNDLFEGKVPFAQTALLVHKDFALRNPDQVSRYLIQLEESIIKTRQNPEEASRLIVEHGILPDKEIAIASIPRSNLHFSYADEEKEGIEAYFKVFYNYNPLILGGKLPDEDFYFKKQTD